MKSRDSIKLEQARAWITSAKDRWRLQVLSKRLRLKKDGTRKEIPTRIRRFLEGVPWAFVKPAIDFLLEQAPYTGVIANGVDFETAYRPTLTLWQRDAQSAAVGAVRPDATYTLIQDLVEFDNKDSYMLGSSSSCSETVVTDYVWDAGDIEEIPEGSQGVTYAIAAVNRKEDGTFDYQIVKRVAITQHVPEATVQDDVMRIVTHELWDNVYTDSDGKYVDHTGAALDIPEAGVANGVSTRIEGLLENPDCTLKFQVVRESMKPTVVRDASTHTQYEGSHEEAATGAVVPLGNAPDASGGIIKDYESQLQPDGTFSVQRKVKVERPVSQSSVEVRVGRKGKRTTVVNSNQSAPAVTSGVEVGGAARYEKTPGGLYNNTVTTFDKTEPVVAGDRCKEDLFSHVDSKTTGGATMPEDADHVEGGGVGGKVVSRDTDMDEEGAVTQTVTVEQEKPVEKAEERWEVSLDGVTHTKTDRNQPAASAGAAPAFAVANIGKTVMNRRTPGGLYDVTVVEIDRTTGALDIRATCRSDVFSHVDSKSTTDPAGTVDPTAHVNAAGGGYVYERSSELNRNGSVTRTETTTKENQHEAGKTYRKTLRGTITTSVTRNTTVPASRPSRIGETQSHEVTPGGLYNLTVTEVEASATPDSARCAKTIFEEVDDAVTMTDEGIPSNFHAAAPDAGAGTYQTKTADTDEYGFTKIVERTTTEKSVTEAQLSYRRTTRGLVTTRVDRNVTTAATDPGTEHPGESKSHEKTPSGRYNLTTVTVAASSDPDSRRCAKTVFEHTDDVVSMATSLSTEHAEAGNGSYGTVDEQMDEYGFVRKVKRTTTETEQEAGHTFRRTSRGLIETTVTRNGTKPAQDPGETSVGCTQSDEMTPGGRYNLTVTKLTASSKKDSAHHAKTVFEDVDDDVVMGTGEVDDAAPAREDGTTVVKDSTLDDYGFVKTVTRTTTENEQEAGHTFRRTSRGLIKTTVTRNTAVRADDPGESNVGCTQSDEMTPGGRYNLTKVELTPSTKTDSAHHARTAFEDVDDEVEMGTGEVDDTEPARDDGTTVVKDSTLDDYGFVKTVTRTTTENEQEAGHTFRRTSRGLIKTTVTRNTAERADDPGESNVGCTQSDEMTPGGRYNLTKVELTPSTKTDSAHHARTKFEDVDDEVKMGTGEVDDTAPTRADGTTVIKDSMLDDYGFVKTVTRTTTEKAVQQARVEYRRTRRGLITTTVDRNVTTTAQDPGDSKVGCSQSHSYNPGGTTDFTKVELQASAKEDSAYWSQDLYSTVNDEVEMSEGQVDKTDPGAVSKGTGYYHTKTSELDDYGFAKTVTRTTTEKNVPDARINFEADHFHKTEVRTNANKTSPDETELEELTGGSHGQLSMGKQINYNRGGTADEVVTKVTPVYRSWTDIIDTNYVVGKIFYFRNATSGEWESVRTTAQEYLNSEALSNGLMTVGPYAPSAVSFTPSCTLNAYGLYDGQYSVMFHWAATSGGKGTNHIGDFQLYAEWRYNLVSCNMTPTFSREDGAVTGYRQVSVKREVHEIKGRGWQAAVDRWMQGKDLIEGSSAQVTPESGDVHLRLIERATTSIEYVEVSGNQAKEIEWEF